MSLRFADGFDHYDNPHVNQKWTNSHFQSGGGLQTAASRTSGLQGCRLQTGGPYGPASSYLQKSIDQQSTWIVGFAWRPGDILLSQGNSGYACSAQEFDIRKACSRSSGSVY